MRKAESLILILSACSLAINAQETEKGQGQDIPHFEIRATGGYLWSNNWSKQTVFGGDIEVSDNVTIGGEISYYFNKKFSVQAGISSHKNELTLKGADLSDLNFTKEKTELPYGHVWSTPINIGVVYHQHFGNSPLSVYGGADFTYTLFNHKVTGAYIKDITYTNVKGFDLKIGADYELPCGLFADLECKKGWEDRCNLDIDVSNFIEDDHVPAQIQRKPLTLQLGIGYRF